MKNQQSKQLKLFSLFLLVLITISSISMASGNRLPPPDPDPDPIDVWFSGVPSSTESYSVNVNLRANKQATLKIYYDNVLKKTCYSSTSCVVTVYLSWGSKTLKGKGEVSLYETDTVTKTISRVPNLSWLTSIPTRTDQSPLNVGIHSSTNGASLSIYRDSTLICQGSAPSLYCDVDLSTEGVTYSIKGKASYSSGTKQISNSVLFEDDIYFSSRWWEVDKDPSTQITNLAAGEGRDDLVVFDKVANAEGRMSVPLSITNDYYEISIELKGNSIAGTSMAPVLSLEWQIAQDNNLYAFIRNEEDGYGSWGIKNVDTTFPYDFLVDEGDYHIPNFMTQNSWYKLSIIVSIAGSESYITLRTLNMEGSNNWEELISRFSIPLEIRNPTVIIGSIQMPDESSETSSSQSNFSYDNMRITYSSLNPYPIITATNNGIPLVVQKGDDFSLDVTLSNYGITGSMSITLQLYTPQFENNLNIYSQDITLDQSGTTITLQITHYIRDFETGAWFCINSGSYFIVLLVNNEEVQNFGIAFRVDNDNHVIFTAVAFDSGYIYNFEPGFNSVEEYLDYAFTRPVKTESQSGTFTTYNGGFEEMTGYTNSFKIFHNFNPTGQGDVWADLSNYYKNVISGSDWNPGSGTHFNNGFDYLIGLTDDYDGGISLVGVNYVGGNMAIMGMFDIDISLARNQIIIVHEFCHLWGADHLNEVPNLTVSPGYVMYEGNANSLYPSYFVFHWYTIEILSNYIGIA